jgi:hypothetical protein
MPSLQSCVIASEAKQALVIAKGEALKQSHSQHHRLGRASMLAQRRLRPTCDAGREVDSLRSQ